MEANKGSTRQFLELIAERRRSNLDQTDTLVPSRRSRHLGGIASSCLIKTALVKLTRPAVKLALVEPNKYYRLNWNFVEPSGYPLILHN